MSIRQFILKSVVCFLFLPVLASAQQLREFDIVPIQSSRIPVFTQHADKAAVIIQSSLTNLQFESNLEIVAILGNASDGEYILIVNPVRQIISVRASGYQQGRIPVTLNQARQVSHFKIEPKDRIVTETASLIVRTDPVGATVSIDGIPGEYTTPHTFQDILAMTHTLRIRLEDYQTEERLVRLESGRANVETVSLIPTFGYLMIREPNLELFLKTADDPREFRVTYTPGQPLKRPVGSYSYRLVKNFHRPAMDTMTISRGQVRELNPVFLPDYSTLRVKANAPSFRLSSTDNRAPQSTNPSLIYLEPGQRDVLVEASGFAPVRLSLRTNAGAVIDTTITLLSVSAARDLVRREALPPGMLQLSADVEADIYVNGKLEGRLETVLTLVPGRYAVEFRHPLKTERLIVDVPSADLVVRQVVLRPARSTALTWAAVLPGSGHLYTKQMRGYGYLVAFSAGTAFAVMQNGLAAQKTSDYDEAYRQYLAATSIADAALYKGQAEAARRDANRAITLMTYGIATAAGTYLLQLADLSVTKPKYGYRSLRSTVELGLGYNGIHVTYRLP